MLYTFMRFFLVSIGSINRLVLHDNQRSAVAAPLPIADVAPTNGTFLRGLFLEAQLVLARADEGTAPLDLSKCLGVNLPVLSDSTKLILHLRSHRKDSIRRLAATICYRQSGQVFFSLASR